MPLVAVVGVALLASCAPAAGGVSTVAPTPTQSASRATPQPSTVVDGRLAPCPPSDQSPALPDGLPDITLACLDPGSGVDEVRLAGVRGKPMVLSVWASWCEPCRAELPAVAEVERAAGGSVRFLGVDVEDTAADGQALAAALSVRFNSVQDPDGATKQSLGWIGPPITLYVDAAGHVVGRTIGPVGDAADLRELIRANLGITVR